MVESFPSLYPTHTQYGTIYCGRFLIYHYLLWFNFYLIYLLWFVYFAPQIYLGTKIPPRCFLRV